MKTHAKIINKILPKGIEQHIKRIINHNHVQFTPCMKGCFNKGKSINVIYHIAE